MFKMQIISSYAILSVLTVNILCNGQKNKDWNITFISSEVVAVPGLCTLISCTLIYPNETKPFTNFQWRACNGTNCIQIFFNNKTEESNNQSIKILHPDLGPNNCSFTIEDIKPEDQGEYAFRVEPPGLNQTSFKPTVKISIQDKPIMDVPPLREGQKANLTCSAPFPCPETPPKITWWIKKTGENTTELKDDNITMITFMSSYHSTLTFTPNSDFHNATVRCDVSYGSENISTSRTLEITCGTNESNEVNTSNNNTENTTVAKNNADNGIEHFLKHLTTSNILSFVVGVVCSALIFSMVLCCCVSCHRGKKQKVTTANLETGVSLEMAQTDVAQTVTNEETPLHEQFNGGIPNTAGPTDGEEEEGAVGMNAKEVDYASIDYSLLKDREPEEGEKDPTETDYAEIKRDKRDNGKETEVLEMILEDGDDQTETRDKMEGEEEL
ncbi:myeloid cell surface antigen CD33 [Puntigrus tetrazona]|uniref:myeloid cell surface antigen CD33 n=1 Tax=Puntigrus tetrazona TaxID=1606681 RepID=UPI001C8AB352|nr:myeloid cell surface antigen CD33 [Puntigrus tetrazona]